MSSNKLLSIVILIVNAIGLFCLIYLAIPYLTHDTVVYNPDAMLPAEAWDGVGMLLTIGFIPLLIANIFSYVFILKGKIKIPLRLIFFVPSLICFCLVVSYLIISFV